MMRHADEIYDRVCSRSGDVFRATISADMFLLS